MRSSPLFCIYWLSHSEYLPSLQSQSYTRAECPDFMQPHEPLLLLSGLPTFHMSEFSETVELLIHFHDVSP